MRFHKIAKTTSRFVISVRLHRTTRLPLGDFHKILCLRTFRKSVQKIQVSLKSDSNEGYSAWRRTYISVISRSLLLRMRNVSDKLCIQNQNTHFVVSNIFFLFRKSYRLWDNLETFCTLAGHRWQYGACALHAGYLRLQILTLKWLQYTRLFQCNNGCTNAPRCYTCIAYSVCAFLVPFGRIL